MDNVINLNTNAGHPVDSEALGATMHLLTTEELAELLRVDASTIRRWRTSQPRQGPPFIHISDRVTKYDFADVREWLARRRVDTEAA